VFTHDARIDYTDSGGPAADLDGVTAWLADALAPFAALQHNMTSHLAEVEADTARACTYFMAIHITINEEGDEVAVTMGGFYQV
jgi:hypothetical protein